MICILLCAFVVEYNWFEPTDKKLIFRVYGYKVFRLKSFDSSSKSAIFCILVFVSGLGSRCFKALLSTEVFWPRKFAGWQQDKQPYLSAYVIGLIAGEQTRVNLFFYLFRAKVKNLPWNKSKPVPSHLVLLSSICTQHHL